MGAEGAPRGHSRNGAEREVELTISEDLLLESGEDDEGDESSRKLSPSLRGENGSHHASTDAGGSELGGDGSRERIVAADSNTHFLCLKMYQVSLDVLASGKEFRRGSAEAQRKNRRGRENSLMKRHMMRTPMRETAGPRPATACPMVAMTAERESAPSFGAGERLRLTDDHELDTVHLLATVDISEVSEAELSKESSDGGGDLESEILVGSERREAGSRHGAVDVSDHGGGEVNGEDIVGIGVESNTGDQAGLDNREGEKRAQKSALCT